jgi:hypothetical protein
LATRAPLPLGASSAAFYGEVWRHSNHVWRHSNHVAPERVNFRGLRGRRSTHSPPRQLATNSVPHRPQLHALHQDREAVESYRPRLHQAPDQGVGTGTGGVAVGQPPNLGLHLRNAGVGLKDFFLKFADSKFVAFHRRSPSLRLASTCVSRTSSMYWDRGRLSSAAKRSSSALRLGLMR